LHEVTSNKKTVLLRDGFRNYGIIDLCTAYMRTLISQKAAKRAMPVTKIVPIITFLEPDNLIHVAAVVADFNILVV